MKLIGNLLMTVCLLAGLLAASTSYLAPVSRADSSWETGTDSPATRWHFQKSVRSSAGSSISPSHASSFP